MPANFSSTAIVFNKPKELALRAQNLKDQENGELVFDIDESGISTGTKKYCGLESCRLLI